MKIWKHAVFVLSLFLCALVLPACGGDQPPPEETGNVLIYAALNPISKETQKSINLFNSKHMDIQIEVCDYSDEGGLERLQTELVLGKVPDIMEMHCFGKAGSIVSNATFDNYIALPGIHAEAADEYWMPYRQMVQKGYLENLWPYIESDPDLGKDGVLHPPLKASEIGDGLYILFKNTAIFTLTGRASVVGNRYSWTMEDIKEVLAGMPEGSTIMRYNMTRRDAFFNLLRFSLDRFVDWDTGICHFNSEGFHELVQFLETFPDEVDYEDPIAAEDEVIHKIRDGKQMLEGNMIIWQKEIGISDAIWQERAAFPGYPTSDGSSGSFFYPLGTILSMSATCPNKDAAWEYIRGLIRPLATGQKPLTAYIPINLHDFEMILWGELRQQDKFVEKLGILDDPKLFHKSDNPIFSENHFTYGPAVHLMDLLTEEDTQRYTDLIDHTTQLYWPNDDLSNIVWETLGPYFAGDWTLDHTIEMVQNRVQLYVDEQR